MGRCRYGRILGRLPPFRWCVARYGWMPVCGGPFSRQHSNRKDDCAILPTGSESGRQRGIHSNGAAKGGQDSFFLFVADDFITICRSAEKTDHQESQESRLEGWLPADVMTYHALIGPLGGRL